LRSSFWQVHVMLIYCVRYKKKSNALHAKKEARECKKRVKMNAWVHTVTKKLMRKRTPKKKHIAREKELKKAQKKARECTSQRMNAWVHAVTPSQKMNAWAHVEKKKAHCTRKKNKNKLTCITSWGKNTNSGVLLTCIASWSKSTNSCYKV